LLIANGTSANRSKYSLVAVTRGQGDVGNVIIDAGETVSFNGTNTAAFSLVVEGRVGKGGNIQISADSLSFTKGAGLSASTFGIGNVGNIEINAKNSVAVIGTNLTDGSSSAIFTSTISNSTGRGGDITDTVGEIFLNI
jgi:hypothetical protein